MNSKERLILDIEPKLMQEDFFYKEDCVPIMRQSAIYKDIETSEKQIDAGQIKDARTALNELRTKYCL